MAIKNIIAKGIGFTSDGTIWIPTHGFTIGSDVAPAAIFPADAGMTRRGAAETSMSRRWVADTSMSRRGVSRASMSRKQAAATTTGTTTPPVVSTDTDFNFLWFYW